MSCPRRMRLPALLFSAVGLAACGTGQKYNWSHGSGDGGQGGTTTTEAACDQRCEDGPPVGYEDDLVMVWTGAPKDVPACPTWAPAVAFAGYADLTAPPHTCPTCACEPPACTLPITMEVASAACADAAGASMTTSTNPPDDWTGACTTEGAIPALQCDGPFCSLAVDPPALVPCDAAATGPPAAFPEPAWGQMALACRLGALDGRGCPLGQLCAPAPQPGFAICSVLRSDTAAGCPPGKRRLVFFDTTADTRACTPCSCGPPDGTCSATVSVYTNSACADASLLGAVTVTSMTPAGCVDLPAGAALAAKAASLAVDEPGACAPAGGKAQGSLEPAGQVTFCCGDIEPETG